MNDMHEHESKNPSWANEFVEDMCEHGHNMEVWTSVRPVFMESQPELKERIRSILVHGLVELDSVFDFVPGHCTLLSS